MRIVSGIQPSGSLHLGNYFGAIVQQVALQDEGDAFYFIADYHALTTVSDGDLLRRNTRDLAAAYLALGIDPGRATLFRQSDVPEVTELKYLLETAIGVGPLMRSHAFREKVKNGLQPNTALLTYPVLMAADILAFKGEQIPVGKDQVQHIELCKDMAQSFNHRYGVDVLNKPEAKLAPTTRVPGTDGRKMSKSYHNTIPIFARGKQLKRAISAIVTDSKNPKIETLDPTTCNAFAIYSLFVTGDERDEMIAFYENAPSLGFPGYGEIKKRILAKMDQRFEKARADYDRLIQPDSELEDILREGGRKARSVARETLDLCREAVGFG